MTMFIQLQPAYGRDYKTAKDARMDYHSNMGFIVADMFNPWSGQPVNKAQLDGYSVTLRFAQDRKTCKP